MARDISPDEARDEKVYELTAEHYHKLHAKLQGHDRDTVLAVANAVAVELTDDVLNQLVVLATFGTAAAGAKIAALVVKALLAQAEVAALREVEQLEQQRAESQDENRIARAELQRAING
jgi:hypothetical protein